MRLAPAGSRALLATALAGMLAAVLVLARPLGEVKIRVNDLDLLPAGSPVLEADQAIREHFGSDERLILAFESTAREITDPVFHQDLQFFLRQLAASRNIEQLLFDRLYRPRFEAHDVPGDPYLLHPPSPAWIERALVETAVTGQLSAGRSRRVAFLETPALSAIGVASIENRVQEAFARLDAEKPGEYRVRVLGRYVVLNGLGQTVLDDLVRLLPWSFVVIALLFWALFGSWTMVSLALFQSGVTAALTLAIQTRLGHPLSLMTAMIPVLITVLGIADEIHFFDTFLALREERPERAAPALAWETLRRLFFPCTAITLTTVIGFASFWATEAPALRVFGLIAGIGLAVSWLISVTLVPTVLALVPVRGRRRWGALAASLPTANRRRFRGVMVVLSLLLIPGLVRLRIGDGWTGNFRPDHPVVQDVRWFEKESVGLYQLDLMLTRAAGPWTEPAELEALERLQQELAALAEVSASLSLVDLLRDRAWELGDPARARPPLPQALADVDRLLDTYAFFNEAVFVRMFLDRSRSSTRLILAIATDDYRTATRVRRAVDAAVGRAFPGGKVAVMVGGSAERGRILIESIVGNQATTVLLALGISWLILGFASGRWSRAFRCIAANVWALLLVLGLAGWLDIELGVATSSFLALGVGVGLDYAIHLAFHGDEMATAHVAVLGRVAANVLVVGSGLSVLMLSANPTIARLGFLIVASLVASGATAAVAFTPSPARVAGTGGGGGPGERGRRLLRYGW